MKKLSTLILILMMMALFIPQAMADTAAQDGLSVTMSVEGSAFAADEDIPVKISIHNTGAGAIKGISYAFTSPQDYTVNGQTGSIEVGTLAAGAKYDETVLLKRRAPVDVPDTGDHFSPLLAVMGAVCGLGGLVLLKALGRKRQQRFTAFMLSIVLMSSVLSGITLPAAAESNETRTIQVEEAIMIGAGQEKVSLTVTYSVAIPYTRAEWIAYLVDDAVGLQHKTTSAVPYADIAGTRYQAQIETAVAHGMLVPASGEAMFYPDRVATREFAVAMAVRILDFVLNDNLALNAADAGLVQYKKEAALGLELGMISLENGMFMPQRGLSEAEADVISAVIEDVMNSTVVTGEGGEGITYQDGVFQITTDDYTDENGVLNIPANLLPEGFQVGNILVLNYEKAYRAKAIEIKGDRALIRYTEPELDEYIEEIDSYGFFHADAADFIPAEGVQMEILSNTRAGNNSGGLLGKVKLSGEKKLDNGSKFMYEVAFSIPEASFIFDVNLLTNNWKNFYISISPEIEAEFSWGVSETSHPNPPPVEKRWLLGVIPLIGSPGAGLLYEFYIEVSAEGKLGVTCDVNALMGFQVYNNQPRAIGDLDVDLIPFVSGKVEIGPSGYAVAKVIGKDVIGFNASFHGYLEGSAKWRIEENACCIDNGVVGIKLEVELGTDCLVRKLPALKNMELKWEVLNHKLWQASHVEITNAGITSVPECTFNNGTLRGIVAQATDRTAYVQGAKITLTGADGRSKYETSGSTGGYTIVTKEGDYTLKVSKEGFIPFETDVTVIGGSTSVVETLLMVEGTENDTRKGNISGTITNAKTGALIPGVRIDVRRGWNKFETHGDESVQTIYTDGNGKYKAELPIGNYTMVLEKDGFVPNYFNVAVVAGTALVYHGDMMPEDDVEVETADDRLSIVLTWGQYPSDLDAHTRGFSSSGNEMCHVYYKNLKYYVNSEKQVVLDLDDRWSYGPETTSITGIQSGEKYSFYVHDYTNRYKSASTALANSGAQVKVYRGVELIATYNVPAGVGTVWHVFNYDATTKKLIPVNAFSSTGSASQVGREFELNERSISPDKE